MWYNTISYIDQDISVNNLWKLIHEFIDVLNSTEEVTWFEQTKQDELKDIFEYLKWKWSISHDLISTFWSLIFLNIETLKHVVSDWWWEVIKEWLKNSIQILELLYHKERTIWVLIEHLKLYIDNNFLTHLSYDSNINNYISINNEEFFILAITENLYKNAERFTTDVSSIHLSIKEDWDSIIISSSNISSQEFDQENRKSIMSGQWNIISQEWNNNMKWQWIYLFDLAQQLKKVWWQIDIKDSPADWWKYNTHIKITLPKI